jgi:hypothetical protein
MRNVRGDNSPGCPLLRRLQTENIVRVVVQSHEIEGFRTERIVVCGWKNGQKLVSAISKVVQQGLIHHVINHIRHTNFNSDN